MVGEVLIDVVGEAPSFCIVHPLFLGCTPATYEAHSKRLKFHTVVWEHGTRFNFFHPKPVPS